MSNWKFKAGEILTTKHWSGYRRSEATSTVIAVVPKNTSLRSVAPQEVKDTLKGARFERGGSGNPDVEIVFDLDVSAFDRYLIVSERPRLTKGPKRVYRAPIKGSLDRSAQPLAGAPR